ncbi:hypothetical protein [Parasphingopyxis sp.]|uniref:hypothetical protein n=1 Tax=Parasphingopyxis sp. TaxID=1920299 RepID=UPI00261A0B2A|nr:hypothetical protein [Parasphingopyxis sp.]
MTKTLTLAGLSALPVSIAATIPISTNGELNTTGMMIAAVIGSLAAAMYAARNARQDKKSAGDAAFDVLVAITSGIGIGYYLGQPAERVIDRVVDIPPEAGALLMAASGAQIIGWLVEGNLFGWVLDRLGRNNKDV